MPRWNLLFLATLCAPAPAAPQNSAVLKDFNHRIAGYMKIHGVALAEGEGLKPTPSKEEIDRRGRALASHIRAQRREAVPGNIFTADIAREFRRLIALAFQGPNGALIEKSLRDAPTVLPQVLLRVNGGYPDGMPQQSTPPSLLQNLPLLPNDLEYRVLGRNLIIYDVDANLVVDFLAGALP